MAELGYGVGEGEEELPFLVQPNGFLQAFDQRDANSTFAPATIKLGCPYTQSTTAEVKSLFIREGPAESIDAACANEWNFSSPLENSRR